MGTSLAVVLVLTWGVVHLGGGSQTALPHLFYLPIMTAAVRFGRRGAVLVAVAAGLLSGPLLPADTATGTPQDVASWTVRMAVFVAVGLLLGWITAHTRPGLVDSGRAAKVTVGLRRALRDGDLELHYQPLVDLETKQAVGVEALVRWVHPTKGVIGPAEFVPAAEATGMIDRIDRFVLVEATRQLARWTDAGVGALTMSVNLSAHRFRDPDLVRDTASVLEATGVEPSRVVLEVTETAIIEDVEQAATQISRLRDLGVRVAIDDFGAGQSSLSYLHQFTIDVIKIDRGFVSNVVDDARVGRLVAGMVRLVDSIGVRVVGEGISAAGQLVHMTSLGCQVGQGFYIAEPAPAAEVQQWLGRSRQRARRRSRDADGQ